MLFNTRKRLLWSPDHRCKNAQLVTNVSNYALQPDESGFAPDS